MEDIFIQAVNLSISASYLVLAVLILRLLLKKAPKWVHTALWGLVALRLMLPFSIESAISLLPSGQTVPPEIGTLYTPVIQSGIPVVDTLVNPGLQSFAPTPDDSVNPMQIVLFAATIVWLAGIAAMLLYTLVSYARLRWQVRTAVLLRRNIYQSEHISSPFVLGFIRPRIYLPYGLDTEKQAYIIQHEDTHIARRDHWWKPLGFLLLSIYWFNPILWAAYILLCRDIELACDEKAISYQSSQYRADYSEALLACSVKRRSIAACPLAFGEVGVKRRIHNILNYKRPAFWIVCLSLVICTAVGICFLTNPADRGIGQIKLSENEMLPDQLYLGMYLDGAGYTVTQEDPYTIAIDIQSSRHSQALRRQFATNALEFPQYGLTLALDRQESATSLQIRSRIPIATDEYGSFPAAQRIQISLHRNMQPNLDWAKNLTAADVDYIELHTYGLYNQMQMERLPDDLAAQAAGLIASSFQNAQYARRALSSYGPRDISFIVYTKDGERHWVKFTPEHLNVFEAQCDYTPPEGLLEGWYAIAGQLLQTKAEEARSLLQNTTPQNIQMHIYDPGKYHQSAFSGGQLREATDLLRRLVGEYVEIPPASRGLRIFHFYLDNSWNQSDLSVHLSGDGYIYLNGYCFRTAIPNEEWWTEWSALADLPPVPQETQAIQWLRELNAESVKDIRLMVYDGNQTYSQYLQGALLEAAAESIRSFGIYGYCREKLDAFTPNDKQVVFYVRSEGGEHIVTLGKGYFALDGYLYTSYPAPDYLDDTQWEKWWAIGLGAAG